MCTEKSFPTPTLLIPLNGAFVALSLEFAAPLELLLAAMAKNPSWEEVLDFIKNEGGRYRLLLEAGLVSGFNEWGYDSPRDFPEPRLTKLGERYMAALKSLRELK